jgi:hypothetical protein
MGISRAVVAAAAIVIGPSYLLLAQPAVNEKPIGILLAAGDISTCDDPTKQKQEDWLFDANRTAQIIRGEIKDAQAKNPAVPVRVLALGDLAYDDGTEDEFKCFGARWNGFDDVMLPVPGNHEYHTKNAEFYFKYFKDNPFVNQVKGQKGYYALNFPRPDGPWRLIGLNDNFEAKAMTAKADAQLEWLPQQLDMKTEVNKPGCVLAFWHQPTFTSGRHGHKDYKTTSAKKELTKKRPMKGAFDILHSHGATVVLTGHDHNYEQFQPQNGKGELRKKDGIRLFVVGTGGSGLTQDFYKHKETNSEVLYGKDKGNQGVLKIYLFESSYRWEFLQVEREVKGVKQEKKPFTLPTTEGNCVPRKQPPA